ncbi:MAG: hypothetical protein IKL52_07880 [Candidatus Gastranaerophilales bacterium]|nr:hypothetical protein [Candidatus Gastranaerophilales bacterium]
MDKIKKISLNTLIPIVFLMIGIGVFCYPMFLNTDKMPGDFTDARFINYVLEHGYLWLNQIEIHKNFWDMPIFYPHKNTLAYSDIMLGAMLIYSPIRFIVKNPQSAFQIFYVITLILNFTSFYFLAKKFKLNSILASFSAYFFAFCLARHAQTIHLQLFWQFYMIFSILCFISISSTNSKLKNRLLFLGGVAFFVVQTYSAFYFGWYMAFCAPILLFSFLLQKETRTLLINWFKNIDKICILEGLIGFIALLPLCYHYLLVGSKFAKAQPSSAIHLLFSQSFLDSLFIDYSYFYFPEALLGVGLITTLTIIIAILKNKYRIPILTFVVALILIFCNNRIYSFLYDNFFPMGAIRALGRYIFVLIPIFALILAFHLKKVKHFYWSIILMLLIMVEQMPYVSYFDWDKKTHNARINRFSHNENCKVIYYDFDNDAEFMKNNLDVMWYATNNDKYCVNEYSGFIFKYDTSKIDNNCKLNVK